MNNPNQFRWGKSQCAYCGKSPATEAEHVVARGFFPKSIRASIPFIIVPACKDCNHGVGSDLNNDEDYVRSYLSMMFNAQFHKNSLAIANGEVARSMDTGHGAGRKLLTGIKITDKVSESGLWLGHELRSKPEWDRIDRVLSKIVRGLHFHETGRVLPPDHIVTVNAQKLLKSGKIDLDLFMAFDHNMDRNPYVPKQVARQELGDYTFAWWAYLSPNSDSGVWFISFYNGAMAAVVTVLPPKA